MKKEIKIGIMGIVALVVLFFGIKFLKGIDIFTNHHTYYVAFPDAKGLSKNSKVYANGYDIGIVKDIIYDYERPGNIIVEVSVDPRVILRTGSIIRLDNGLMGGCTLNMYLENNLGTIYQPGDTIQGSISDGLMTKAADMMPQVQQLIAEVDQLVKSVNLLINNPDIPIIVSNIREVTANLNVTAQNVNGLLKNEVPTVLHTYNNVGNNVIDLTDNLKKVDIQQTLDSVNATLASVHQVMENVQNPNGTVGKLLKDPALYDNLNHTVQSADSLVTDLKAHPKRYVHFSVFGKKDK